MAPLSRSAFADALAALDRASLARFVAAVERARGRTATVEDGTVVVRDGTGERRLAIHDPGWLDRSLPRPPPDADAVVTPLRDPGFESDLPVVDADDLRDIALYGVPSDERDRLFAEYLGRDPTATEAESGAGPTAVALLALAMLVVAAAVVGTGAGGPAASSEPAATATPEPTTFRTVAGDRYPPGLSAEGVVDPVLLGRAHEEALEGESYTLSSNRTVRYANGTLRSQLGVRVRLAGNRSYLARARTAGPYAPVFLGRPPAHGVYWSNGTVYARRLTRDGERVYNTFEPANGLSGAGRWQYWTTTVPYGGGLRDPERLYGQVFGAMSVSVITTHEPDGRRRHVLLGGADRVPSFLDGADARNVTVSASVSDRGVVRSFQVRYETTVDGKDVVVEWRIRYDDVGRTTVERPPWLDRALRGERETVGNVTAGQGTGGNASGRGVPIAGA